MAVASGQQETFAKYIKYGDVGIAIVVIGIIMMLVIPLPPALLDILLVLNIMASIVTILVSIYIKDPLEFAVFPTMLLVATLYRLALDISATRLILLQGHKTAFVQGKEIPIGAGHVIPKFADFVVGGDLIVGFIIFIILITVQFIVITQGAERIAQVGARFTLDAMPGKQMAIDADLHSGLIDAEEAKKRRRDIEREADFYGAMDGAGKFVKGDAMAAIVIMLVSIIGGLIIGIVTRKMEVMKALHNYALLTIGNGLVTTLPAFLMSTAMGMVVSRAASEANLGQDVVKQLTAQPKALKIAGFFAVMIAFLSFAGLGLPGPPFLILAIILLALGYILDKQQAEQVVVQATEQKKAAEEVTKKPESVVSLMQVDPLSVEVGRALLPLVNPDQGAKLLERVTSIRRHVALELGIVVPGVRFRDNLQLKPNQYRIKIKDIDVGEGEVVMNHFLAIGPEAQLRSLKGTKCLDPTYGMPGVWIPPDQRGEAEKLGCMIFDPVSVVATQITEVIRNHSADLLGRQEVQALIDSVKRTHPAVVKDLVPDALGLGEVQKVLQYLVKERVSIRDLVTIMETMADHIHLTKDPDLLTEYVRQAMSRVICREYINNENVIHVFTLDPQVEQIINQSVQRTEFGSFLTLDPQIGQEILTALGEEMQKFNERGLQPIVLCNPQVRMFVRKLAERNFPNLVVLSYNEVAPKVQVQSVGMVTLNV